MIPKFRNLSKAQQRDYDWYFSCAKQSRSYQLIKAQVDYTAASLEEWYFLWDTHGIIANYSDMQLAGKLTEAKDKLNLTIKLWVEDIQSEMCILMPEEVHEYCKTMPGWVWKSFVGQMDRANLPFSYQQTYKTLV